MCGVFIFKPFSQDCAVVGGPLRIPGCKEDETTFCQSENGFYIFIDISTKINCYLFTRLVYSHQTRPRTIVCKIET